MSEHDEQAALFFWASFNEKNIPELAMMYAVPNGGLRDVRVARKMKAEGVKAGVLDINLDVPRGGYHGLRIEMKFGKNKPTKKQKEWMQKYAEYGYCVKLCYNWIEARDAIMDYLAGGGNKNGN